MNIKEERSRAANGMKILNDERISEMPNKLAMSVPLAPTKQINLSMTKNKTSPRKKKQMDHYVLQTIKGEGGEEGVESEIDFILADNTEDGQPEEIFGGPSGEITEELHLNYGDEEDEDGGDEKTEEIVEHVCCKCYKSFRRLSGLKKHLDFCRFDSDYHLRKAEMMKNLEKIEKDAIIMENKDVCFCCGESYDTFHLGHINCPDCPKSFKSQMSYERHIFITHSELEDFPCTICNAKLRSSNLQKLHIEQHKNRGKPFACKICGKDFTRSYHLKRHQKYSSCSANLNDSMNCKVCNKAFYRLDNLRAHLKQHLGKHVTKKPEYMCPICKNCFYSLSTLNIHTRTHTGERPFDCDLCDKKFPSLVALKKHRRYHTGEKPYTCSVCSQSFAVKEVLNRHMKRHTGERPHVCQECGKSFIQATQLRCHAKTHIRPYECSECKELFKTERQLERHSKTHNKEHTLFKCKQCNMTFRKEVKLIAHEQRGVHNSPVRKRRGKARTDCAICEKNFDTTKSLQFHILKVHEVDPEEFINEKPSTDDGEVDPQKVYKSESRGNNRDFTSSEDSRKATSAPSNNGVVVEEFIVDELPTTSGSQTIVMADASTFTVIPLDNDGGPIETVTTNTLPTQITPEQAAKKGQRKSLAESLAAAIADNDDADEEEAHVTEPLSEEDLKWKENVRKLLDMLVDNSTLKKFGWPQASEEIVLCKVIENCGHDLKEEETKKDCDYATRMREYVKVLFTVVIHNDSIKELLNNYPIDEVIEYVLGNDDEDEGEEGDGDEDEDMEVDEDEKDQSDLETAVMKKKKIEKSLDTMESHSTVIKS